MDTRPLDELETLILRHLASGPHSASELADALRQYGVAPSRPAVVYRLGGLVSLKLVASAERKAQRGGAEFIYSLRSEPKATTEAAPPNVEVQAEPPKAEPPKGTQELSPKEDAPPYEPDPQASPDPCNVDLLIQQIRARHAALMAQRHRALLAEGQVKGGHLR